MRSEHLTNLIFQGTSDQEHLSPTHHATHENMTEIMNTSIDALGELPSIEFPPINDGVPAGAGGVVPPDLVGVVPTVHGGTTKTAGDAAVEALAFLVDAANAAAGDGEPPAKRPKPAGADAGETPAKQPGPFDSESEPESEESEPESEEPESEPEEEVLLEAPSSMDEEPEAEEEPRRAPKRKGGRKQHKIPPWREAAMKQLVLLKQDAVALLDQTLNERHVELPEEARACLTACFDGANEVDLVGALRGCTSTPQKVAANLCASSLGGLPEVRRGDKVYYVAVFNPPSKKQYVDKLIVLFADTNHVWVANVIPPTPKGKHFKQRLHEALSRAMAKVTTWDDFVALITAAAHITGCDSKKAAAAAALDKEGLAMFEELPKVFKTSLTVTRGGNVIGDWDPIDRKMTNARRLTPSLTKKLVWGPNKANDKVPWIEKILNALWAFVNSSVHRGFKTPADWRGMSANQIFCLVLSGYQNTDPSKFLGSVNIEVAATAGKVHSETVQEFAEHSVGAFGLYSDYTTAKIKGLQQEKQILMKEQQKTAVERDDFHSQIMALTKNGGKRSLRPRK